jgi:hypothetical protein
MSNLLLLSFAAPDLMMAGAAVFATLCGIVLMGGRSVVGRPLRMLSHLRTRNLHRQEIVSVRIQLADRMEQDVSGVQRPLQRVA